MERIMLWWDDLDDVTAALRHVLRTALAEAFVLPSPPAWGSLIGQWLGRVA